MRRRQRPRRSPARPRRRASARRPGWWIALLLAGLAALAALAAFTIPRVLEPRPDPSLPTTPTPNPVRIAPAQPPPERRTTPKPAPPPAPAPRPQPSAPAPEAPATATYLRAARNHLELQVALHRAGFSPGPVDGVAGAQTAAALAAWCAGNGIPPVDPLTAVGSGLLTLDRPPLHHVTLSADDLASLREVPESWAGRIALDRLGHGSATELLAERTRAHPGLLARLNPALETNATPGLSVLAPDADPPPLPAGSVARIRISLGARTLEALDSSGRTVLHAPCSIARRYDKRPVGRLSVVNIAPDPNYTFDPANFPDSPDAQAVGRRHIIAPGPNNPVGVAWLGLDLPGYGIHGTPHPEQVGRTESSGCFRLANWDAARLLALVLPGTPVEVSP